MNEQNNTIFLKQLDEIQKQGLKKEEAAITSAQDAHVIVAGHEILNLCANNYLGLAKHPEIIKAATEALKTHGYGMASVRFICGTQDLHQSLENRISTFLETEETILYSSCFDANTGLFETLFSEEDAIISDTLNHASIIDGIRLCKAKRYRYRHMDMDDLKCLLKNSQKHRLRIVATDGVFSMDGEIAPLSEICDLAEKYEALVMVDDSHATGILGDGGRGSIEHCNVMGRVDLITSTLGKALGGASGGFTSGRKPLIDLLRQRSRPYLFSNSIPPMIAAAAEKAIDLIVSEKNLREKLWENTALFREGLNQLGFIIKPGIHPIIPILIGDPLQTKEMSRALFEADIYAVAFSYPVVPEGQDRIRVQISAAHSKEDLVATLEKFGTIGKRLGLI
ncbi:2-amino-3-ketobutyrate coenzyme A ligase [hydrothermal vent metagenome]|uniref:2-amino-3-ketobutyrate coenzyme A ligase n=1 Tax=hydrothermal vent metagenome TaxID=652676 RepID=A0A3B1CCY0_9ZZZZ